MNVDVTFNLQNSIA